MLLCCVSIFSLSVGVLGFSDIMVWVDFFGRCVVGRNGRVDGYVPEHAAPVRGNLWGRFFTYVGSLMVAVLISGVVVGFYAVGKVDSNFTTVELMSSFDTVGSVDDAGVAVGQVESVGGVADGVEADVLPAVGVGGLEESFNFLIVGSDSRAVQDDGAVEGSAAVEGLNDVNIFVRVNVEKDYMVAVSLPRDLLVNVPECAADDNIFSARSDVPLNSVLNNGGLGCVALTVEGVLGVPVHHAAMLTFTGVANISETIGGVPVCVDAPLVDEYSGLNLPEAGEYELSGWDALAFLRTRYAVGDGSDLSRINLQQQYLSSLLRKVYEDGVLNDLDSLYRLALVVSRESVLSSSLGSVDKLVAMARSLNKVSLDNIVFVQLPVGSAGVDFPGKVKAKEPYVSQLVELLSSDEFFVTGSTGVGSRLGVDSEVDVDEGDVGMDSVNVLEGSFGQTAATTTCSNVR